jgi:hypothetical protein
MCRCLPSRLEHILKGGTPGKRKAEKRATVTMKAAETTGGDLDVFEHEVMVGRRREASWSGGEAERGRRPVFR